MNKNLVLLDRILVIGIIILLFGTSINPSSGTIVNGNSIRIISNGNTLYVGGTGPNNYTRIQEAIDNASDNDTVFVFDDSSPYYEHLIVNKSISLLGENRDTTVIDGGDSGNIIYINAQWVTVSEFSIWNGDIGIFLDYRNSLIEKNNIEFNNKGVFVSGIGYNEIDWNNVSSNINGIVIEDSYRNSIMFNYIHFNKENGLVLCSSTMEDPTEFKCERNQVWKNDFRFNKRGIFINNSNEDEIRFNNFILNYRNIFFQMPRKGAWWFNIGKNYWTRPRILPKLIFGKIWNIRFNNIVWIPYVLLDIFPAKEPNTSYIGV